MTQKAKRKLTKADFSKEGMHMALVSVDQGGPANGINTLMIKSLEGQSELTENQINSLKQIAKASGIPEEEFLEQAKALLESTDGEDPVSETEEDIEKSSNNTSPTEEVNMSTETIEKSVYEAELAKAKQEAEAQAQKLAEYEQIQKNLKDELAEFVKAKEEAEKQEFIAKAKGFEDAGIKEEAQVDALAVALQKASKDEALKPLLDLVEKQAELMKGMEGTEEHGHGADMSEEDPYDVGAIVKARQAERKTK